VPEISPAVCPASLPAPRSDRIIEDASATPRNFSPSITTIDYGAPLFYFVARSSPAIGQGGKNSKKMMPSLSLIEYRCRWNRCRFAILFTLSAKKSTRISARTLII